MDTIRAVTDDVDPKEGKSRAQSGVSFPYFDLETSIEVARTLHHRAGGSCDLPQLATLLNYSGVNNGSFRSRVSAAKMFGLIEETEEKRIRVSQRGLTIVAAPSPQQEAAARVQAFLAIDLFRRVFERYNGTTLPEDAGLRNILANEYRVVPDRVGPTIRIMLDSAEQAGFFRTAGNRSRMVMPLEVNPGATSSPMDSGEQKGTPPRDDPRENATGTGSGLGGGDEGSGSAGGSGSGGGFTGSEGGMVRPEIDPAILGLLQRLPPGGTPLSAKRRKALIDAFTATVAFIYPDEDENE